MAIKKDINRNYCPIGMTNVILGDKWVVLILRELFIGFTRFDEFEKNLQISKSVLSVKLRLLLDHGLIKKSHYQEGNQRIRNEYQLSNKGRSLIFVMGAILEWGNNHMVKHSKAKLSIVDKAENPLRVAFVGNNKKEVALDQLRIRIS